MPANNLNNAMDKAEIQLRKWKQRKLTIMRKITVWMSLILSKFIHIFLLFPIPENFICKLNTRFLQFLWNNNADKIKRDTIFSDYFKGGLKMVNVDEFIKSLKISWVRRFFQAECL